MAKIILGWACEIGGAIFGSITGLFFGYAETGAITGLVAGGLIHFLFLYEK